MLDKETAKKQLQEIKAIDNSLFILIRFVHLLIDESITFEADTNQMAWWLYGELTSIYPTLHDYWLALQEEMEVMYDM